MKVLGKVLEIVKKKDLKSIDFMRQKVLVKKFEDIIFGDLIKKEAYK